MTGVCQNSTARTDYVKRLQLYTRAHTHAHKTQPQGPQGCLSSDRSHCKEAAARTTCLSPPTHRIVPQYESFTPHTLTERRSGLEDGTATFFV